MRRLVATKAHPATILVRLMVGGVFFVEGILKFLYQSDLAAGRFAKIGIPSPEIMGPFVAGALKPCAAPSLISGLLSIAAGLRKFFLQQVSRHNLWRGRCQRAEARPSCRSAGDGAGVCRN